MPAAIGGERSFMDTNRCALIAAVLASMLVLPTGCATTDTGLEQAMSHDGLQKISVEGIDLAYARPGATLAAYDKVRIAPIEVAFRKDWNPTRPGSMIRISTEEREEIKARVATAVHDEFVRELQTNSSYKVVNESGPDVLRVDVRIVDLYINAPDTGTGALSRYYTVSAGEMTLFAELFDSETGQVLARVVDRREARNTGMLTLANRVVNEAEARNIASTWARILRRGLDKAHGIGNK
jgi:hypothetical protein